MPHFKEEHTKQIYVAFPKDSNTFKIFPWPQMWLKQDYKLDKNHLQDATFTP
jgi:hypothetical protein